MAFDPTPEIAAVCRDAGAWLHVDAAMAGIAALVPEHRWVNDGLELADSYCTNPHKWMGINFDCDLYWTADRAALLGALSILPEYLRSAAGSAGAAADLRDWQVPLGRRFRALKLWFGLRLDGVERLPGTDPPPRRAHPAARCLDRRRRSLPDRRAASAQPRVPPPHRRRGDGAADRGGQRHTPGVVHQNRPRRAPGAALLDRLAGDAARHVAAAWQLLQELALAQPVEQVDEDVRRRPPAPSRRRARRSDSTRAVTPRTVPGPSSSPGHRPGPVRQGHGPALGSVGVGTHELGEGHPQDAVDLRATPGPGRAGRLLGRPPGRCGCD